MQNRELFYRHLAQTSPAPLALEIVKADCATLYDAAGKEYIDLIGGISVANIGHRHPRVLTAMQEQMNAYLHVMVYGEFIESPQVRYAQLLASHLPAPLESVYFTNSGTEAIEGAMKLAKRVTNRTHIISFTHSYHGSTQGALSLMGDEYWRNAFRPLLPDIEHATYNDVAVLESITSKTACVVLETIQAEAGILTPDKNWIQALRKRCTETGTLLVLDEIQAAFGRTGSLWGFTITTFGGHPVCCAAGKAAMEALLEEGWMEQVAAKEKLLHQKLVHPKITAVRSAGLWMAIAFDSFDTCKKVIDTCLEQGVLTDWFLFASNCLRISPPLLIHEKQLEKACEVILKACDAC